MDNRMGIAAFVLDRNIHLLDHMAPLASLMKLPLIVNDEEVAHLAQEFYPEVEVRFWPDLPFRLKQLCEEFDVLLNCQYWEPSFKECLRSLFGKEMKLVFCPHGQSDKGYKAPLLESYKFHDLVLIYGNLMEKMLEELHIPIQAHLRVGNYRLLYHQLHKSRRKDFRLNRTLLYAPTWNDADEPPLFFGK